MGLHLRSADGGRAGERGAAGGGVRRLADPAAEAPARLSELRLRLDAALHARPDTRAAHRQRGRPAAGRPVRRADQL